MPSAVCGRRSSASPSRKLPIYSCTPRRSVVKTYPSRAWVLRFFDASGEDQIPLLSAKHVAVVVAVRVGISLFLSRRCANPISCGSVKSMCVPLTGREFAGRNQAVVYRQRIVGGNRQLVSEHVAAAGPPKVPVTMIGQIEDGRLVSCRRIFDAHFIIVGQKICHADVEIAGITLVAVGGSKREFDPFGVRRALNEL